MINVVGAVILDNDGNVIMGKRASTLKNFPDLFEFPGGKVEEGETEKEALMRELEEELNMDVNIEDIEEFEGNQSSHTVEKSGKIIHLTLFIVRDWNDAGNDRKFGPKKGIHSGLEYFNIKKMEEFTDVMIPGDAVFISAIQKFVENN